MHCLGYGDMVAKIGAFQAPYGASAAGEAFADDPARNGNQAMQSLTVVAQVGHPDYNDVTLEFDFALLKLEEPANSTFCRSLVHVDVNFVTQPDCNADYS